ncbi:MAG: hypothetical protein K8R77_07330 [Anaerolineaceae bacterium]|nr:hypothetical protein [Anaerolineaceae bacterium]
MKKIQHQLELSFWDITIQTLSENKLARHVFRDAYRLTREPELFQDWLSIGLTSLAGFISGMGIFFLLSIAY